VHDGFQIDDVEGSEHPDADAALQEATEAARDMLVEAIRRGRDRRHWYISVVDELRSTVATIRFGDVVQKDTTGERDA